MSNFSIISNGKYIDNPIGTTVYNIIFVIPLKILPGYVETFIHIFIYASANISPLTIQKDKLPIIVDKLANIIPPVIMKIVNNMKL